MYYILLALCFSLYSSSASTTLGKSDGTCVNPTTLSFIENSLTNISDQLKGSSNGVSDGINSVTSLFQLSLLKEMVESCKEKSHKDNEEGFVLLRRIELIINSSTADIRILNTSIADLTMKMDNSIADLNTKLDSSISGISNMMNVITDSNARLSAIEPQLASLQSQVSSLSFNLKKISQLLSKHVNITVDDEEEAPSSPLRSSCEAILSKWPNSPSGYYSLADVNGHTRHVYCHMETLCGKGGGWRRIASLNMTDPNEKCPTQFRLYSQGGVRACGRPVTSGGSCVGITFPSRDIKYSQVCGKVIGYQYNSPDGANSGRNIDTYYIDGISLTHGSPRKHIWSLISGFSSVGTNNCPCGSINPQPVPSFVGSDYYCESGCNDALATWESDGTLYTDPLWDGKGCGSSETTCCQRNLIPWFYKSFGYSTTDYIEMRVCCDQYTVDEDVTFEQYEVYVK